MLASSWVRYRFRIEIDCETEEGRVVRSKIDTWSLRQLHIS